MVCGSVDPPIRRVLDFRMIYAERLPASTARLAAGRRVQSSEFILAKRLGKLTRLILRDTTQRAGRAATRDTALSGSPRYTLPIT